LALWLSGSGFLFHSVAAIAQESVYSGAFIYGEGGLTSPGDLMAVTNFETSARKTVSIINYFFNWENGGVFSAFPINTVNTIRANGSIPLLSWQPWQGNFPDPAFSLTNIINGNFDSYITGFALQARAWGYPFFLRFAHEMNGDWYPWAESSNGNAPGEYVQMWQHVHNIFTAVGVTNATWVWCVNTEYTGSTPVAELYPGDNYVDWISLDAYNRLANPWEDLSGIVPATLTDLTRTAPGKPIMLAETGCNQNTNYSKAQWFLNALTNCLPATPRIKAWVYFNSTNTSDGNDWRITSPSNAVIGYQEGIALSYYDRNRYGAISSSPIQPLLNDNTTTDTMPPFVSIVSPAMDQVTNGAVTEILALASDKYGISNVVFSVNGAAQQTNDSTPYQFLWTVPLQGVMTYTLAATAYDNGGNSAVSTIQVVSQAPATNIIQTVSEGTGTNWNNASWGSPPAVPASGNDYETPNGFDVRTPNSTAPAAFIGASLQIDSGGTLYLKNGGETSGNAANVNLLLTGGDMRFHGGFSVNGPAVSGTVQVLSNSLVDTDQMPPNNGDIWLQSPISGNGNLTVNMSGYTNSLILSGDNSAYTGDWTNTSAWGSIEILSGTANALGSGNVTLANTGSSLVFNSTNNLVVNNLITGPGFVVQENTNTVVLCGNDTFTGPLQIRSGILELGANASIGGTTTIQLSAGATLNVTNLTGGFVVGNAQTIAGEGNVVGNVVINGSINPELLGTLNFSNSLTLAGTTIIELNRTNIPNADLISAATLVYGGTLTVANLGGALQSGDTFQLFSGAINGTFAATNFPALSANLVWDTSKFYSQGILAVALQAAPSPVILPPSWNGTNFVVQVNSLSGYNYALQMTPQLAPASWVNIQTNPGGGTLNFTVPINPTNTQQFFRIWVP
jgi:beta-mannanase